MKAFVSAKLRRMTFVIILSLSMVADPGFPKGVVPTSDGGGGGTTYYFAIFPPKLRENERIWTERGRASGAPSPWIRHWRLLAMVIQDLLGKMQIECIRIH